MRAPVMSALLVLLAGCSSQPTAQDPPASGAAPVPPPPAAEIVVAAPEPGTTQSAGEKTDGKIPSGYRRETRKGKELYCRQITTLGTRFAQKLCFTREQLVEMQRRTDSLMGDLDRGMRVCSSAEACGGATPSQTAGGTGVAQ